MTQVLQNFSTGKTELVDVPSPGVRRGHLLIETRASLISLGTERMLVSFGRAGYLEKARQQPEKVKQVVAKAQTDGIAATIEAVKAKLDAPLPMGYCNAGIVREVGEGVTGFEAGDYVVSNGGHAEVVLVPQNLCAKIPSGVTFESACFTVAASIPLQGVRLLQPQLGEAVLVTGLGLMGVLAVQILTAHGCQVMGVDLDPEKCRLAKQFGCKTVCPALGEDLAAHAQAFTGGRGMDAVLITASTPSSDPVNQAAQICRKRGRIVQVGATGLNLLRDPFYKKELSIQVSCSYGPGRYDPAYEEKGMDYPIAYVRWTEQRNFEAILGMMANGLLKTGPLVSHDFAISNAEKAYDLVAGGTGMGILLKYPGDQPGLLERTVTLSPETPAVAHRETGKPVGVGVIGAGAFCARFILPALKKAGAKMVVIASAQGVSGTHHGRKFGFEQTTTDAGVVISSPEVDLVVIATQHNTHAKFVEMALKAGKAVYVEKPLCLNRPELESIRQVYNAAEAPYLMVGFNRRFAPHIVKMSALLEGLQAPKVVSIMVNAGYLPADHWHHDPLVGGGRMIAEGCHFIDLSRFLVGSPVVSVDAIQLAQAAGLGPGDDKAIVTVRFKDGSIGSIHYLGNGSKDYPKERVEVFCDGKILRMDNFRSLKGFGLSHFRSLKSWRQDKGHAEEIRKVIYSLKNNEPAPIPAEEIFESMEATFSAVEKAAQME